MRLPFPRMPNKSTSEPLFFYWLLLSGEEKKTSSCATLCYNVRHNSRQHGQLDMWPLPPPPSGSFYRPLWAEELLLSSLHSSAVVSVMRLFRSGALLQATIRHCLIYTHYFLVFSVGFEGRKNKLQHNKSYKSFKVEAQCFFFKWPENSKILTLFYYSFFDFYLR